MFIVDEWINPLYCCKFLRQDTTGTEANQNTRGPGRRSPEQIYITQSTKEAKEDALSGQTDSDVVLFTLIRPCYVTKGLAHNCDQNKLSGTL